MVSHATTPKDETLPPPLAPRVDWLGMTACIFAAGVVLMLAGFKVGSLDIGYHISYGRHFLETGEIVGARPDPSLYPETAIPFVNANWGSQVIMALAERAGGAMGLFALRIALIGIIFASIAAVVRQFVPNWLAVATAWLFAALPAYERFSMRPELFSYAILSLQLLILTRGLKSWKSVAVLAGLQIAWVNLHSYFLVGLCLSGVWLIGLLLRQGFSRLNVNSNRADPRHPTGMLAMALLIQILVCGGNPQYLRGALFPLKTLDFLKSGQVIGETMKEAPKSAWSAISEFHSPFSFIGESICGHTITAWLAFLAIAGFGVVTLLAKGRFASAGVILLFLLMATQMRRNIAQFAFVAAPLSVAGIAMVIPWSKLRSVHLKSLRVTCVTFLIAASCWIITTVANGSFYYHERRVSREFGTGYSDRTFPQDAVRWLADNKDLQPNLFVDYFSSSNTLPWLPARFQLFVNTNTFAYEDATLATAFKLGQARIPHAPFLDKHGVNIILLHCGPDTQLMVRNLVHDDGNWALVFFDEHTVIFVRRIVPHVDVILQNHATLDDLDAARWIAHIDKPDHAKALTLGTMINVPMSLGWWKPASILAREAVRLAPDYHEAWHYLGVAEVNLGKAAARNGDIADAVERWKKGIQCFDKVLALWPDHTEAKRFRDETKRILELAPRP